MSEFQTIADGYFQRDERKWAHTRYLAHLIYAQLTGEVVSPSELIPTVFDGNKTTNLTVKKEPVTKEELEEFKKKWLKKEDVI